MDEIKQCVNCLHWNKETWEEPCRGCKNNLTVFDDGYETAPFLWESNGSVYPERKADVVNHPSHYTQGDIECIDAMIAAYGKKKVSDYCVINAFKYIWRHEHKNGVEDVKKAIWYLNKSVELEETANEEVH